MYDELDDEMHKQVPDARSSLQALKDLGMTRFRFDNWLQVMKRRKIGDEDAKRRLQDLFDYSVVGVQRRGGITRGTTFQFVYHDRLLEPNFHGDMIVHPSLTKHLRLKEPRAKGTSEIEPEDPEFSWDDE